MPSCRCAGLLAALCALAAAPAAAAAPYPLYMEPQHFGEAAVYSPEQAARAAALRPYLALAEPDSAELDRETMDRIAQHFLQLDADYRRLTKRGRSARLFDEAKRQGKQCFFNPVTCFGRK